MTETEAKRPVQLYLYDLSHGMARILSVSITGKQIVVYNGVEYFFGMGIQKAVPGTTQHGKPMKVLDMGTTHIPDDVFEEFLESMKLRFKADTYHLLDNNCNNFSNEVVQFLTGKSIPSFITSLPEDFLSTQLGQALLPMIESFMGPSTLSPAQSRSGITSQENILSKQPTKDSSIQQLASESELLNLCSQHKCLVVFFTSSNCPPCRVIAPIFEQLVEEFSVNEKVVGAKVDVKLSPVLVMNHGIAATPTFIFFLDGKKFCEVKGADKYELRSCFQTLVFTAFPKHPHMNIQYQVFQSLPKKMILFSKSSDIHKITKKLLALYPLMTQEDQNVLQDIENFIIKENKNADSEFANRINELCEQLCQQLSPDSWFPIVDLLRLLVLEYPIRSFFIQETNDFIMHLMKFGNDDDITILRLACNMFKDSKSASFMLSSQLCYLDKFQKKESFTPQHIRHCEITTQKVVDGLLSEKAAVRQTAASLAFNMGKCAYELKAESDMSQQEENWIIECIGALCAATENEEDSETLSRLLAALAFFLYRSTSPILELCQVLDLPNSLSKVQDQKSAIPNISNLCEDIVKMVQVSL